MQIGTVALYGFKRLLLLKGTMFAITGGEIRLSIFSNFKDIIELFNQDMKFVYSLIFLIIITAIYVAFIWINKHFRFKIGQ
jgi:hypothetical protein